MSINSSNTTEENQLTPKYSHSAAFRKAQNKYRKNNKNKIKEINKKYYNDKKDIIKQKQKIAYQKRKQKKLEQKAKEEAEYEKNLTKEINLKFQNLTREELIEFMMGFTKKQKKEDLCNFILDLNKKEITILSD